MHSRRPVPDFYTVAASRKYQQPGSFTYWPTGRINAPHMYSTAFLHNWRQSDRDWVNASLMTSFIEVICVINLLTTSERSCIFGVNVCGSQVS